VRLIVAGWAGDDGQAEDFRESAPYVRTAGANWCEAALTAADWGAVSPTANGKAGRNHKLILGEQFSAPALHVTQGKDLETALFGKGHQFDGPQTAIPGWHFSRRREGK